MKISFKKHRKEFEHSLVRWLPIGFGITVAFLFAYFIMQQNLRMGANDPQIEAVREISSALESGAPYSAFSSGSPIDMSESLSPYVLIYDADRKPVAASGILHGNLVTPPAGIFDYVKLHGEDRVTWQPEKGVRQALVAAFHSGQNPAYIFVGRSLSEVENRESWLFSITSIAWSIAMLGSLCLTVFLS